MSENNNMKWYTIQVYSSMEKNVKRVLEERIARSELAHQFGQILLPVEKVQDSRNGRLKTVERRMYPGYVFIEMEMNDDTWHLVNSTPRVIEFLGGNKPVVLSAQEVAVIKQVMGEAEVNPRPSIEFTIGEQVRIVDTPFANHIGTIKEVDYTKSRMKVVTEFMGDREVELPFGAVEKL